LVGRREKALADGGDSGRRVYWGLLSERGREWKQRDGEKAGRERESSHRKVTGEVGRTSEL